jgi:lysophospholipase L1-like esterase
MVGSPIRVVCAGDGITGGRHGISYVKLLNRRPITATPTFIPAGGGDNLAYNLAQRLDRIIELQPDVVTVLIGTNDARAVLSDNNARAVMVRKRLPSCPTLCR